MILNKMEKTKDLQEEFPVMQNLAIGDFFLIIWKGNYNGILMFLTFAILKSEIIHIPLLTNFKFLVTVYNIRHKSKVVKMIFLVQKDIFHI